MKRDQRRKGQGLSQFLYGLSLIFLFLGLFNLGWAVWPPPMHAAQFNIPTGVLPGGPEGMALASLSAYELNISWPRWMRQGEPGLIYMQLVDLDREPLSEGVERAAQVVLVEPALYPLQVEPPGGVQANLGDDQDLTLSWQVVSPEQGAFPGKLFVSFGFYDEDQAELVEVPVAVVDLNIQVIGLWGLPSGLMIWFGMVSLVLWGALFLFGRMAASRG